jgi:hypothetical protein
MLVLMDLLSNSESIERLEEILGHYYRARTLSLKTFPSGLNIDGVEDEMNRLKDLLEEARCEPGFRLGVRS